MLLHLAQMPQPLLQVRRIMLARNAHVYLVFICITTFLMNTLTKLEAIKFKVFTFNSVLSFRIPIHVFKLWNLFNRYQNPSVMKTKLPQLLQGSCFKCSSSKFLTDKYYWNNDYKYTWLVNRGFKSSRVTFSHDFFNVLWPGTSLPFFLPLPRPTRLSAQPLHTLPLCAPQV